MISRDRLLTSCALRREYYLADRDSAVRQRRITPRAAAGHCASDLLRSSSLNDRLADVKTAGLASNGRASIYIRAAPCGFYKRLVTERGDEEKQRKNDEKLKMCPR